jgi:hypothetical protein
MVDRDIQFRFESLEPDHLNAVLDYLLGSKTPAQPGQTNGKQSSLRLRTSSFETKTPDNSRGHSVIQSPQT